MKKFCASLLGLLLLSSASAATYNYRQLSLGLIGTQATAPVVAPVLPSVNWNTLTGTAMTVDADGLSLTTATNTIGAALATAAGKTSGKWYWEVKVVSGKVKDILIGMMTTAGTQLTGIRPADETGSLGSYCMPGSCNGSYPYATYRVGDVIGLAYDVAGKNLAVYKNNVKQIDIDVSGAPVGTVFYPVVRVQYYNTAGGARYAANFGSKPFSYTPPTGFLKLEP